MSESDPKHQLAHCQLLLRNNLADCALEVLVWRDTGHLPDGQFRKAAAVLVDYDEPLQVAENRLNRLALEAAACRGQGAL